MKKAFIDTISARAYYAESLEEAKAMVALVDGTSHLTTLVQKSAQMTFHEILDCWRLKSGIASIEMLGKRSINIYASSADTPKHLSDSRVVIEGLTRENMTNASGPMRMMTVDTDFPIHCHVHNPFDIEIMDSMSESWGLVSCGVTDFVVGFLNQRDFMAFNLLLDR